MAPPPSELVKAGDTELQSRLEAVIRERDSTLSRAQEMSDKLLDVEKERDSLQVCLGWSLAPIIVSLTSPSLQIVKLLYFYIQL